VFKMIGRIALLILLCTRGFGQDYLQFIENKGQWDANIRFQGQIATGSFALQKTGYRILLHNKKDLGKVYESIHPHHGAETQPGPPKPQVNSTSKTETPTIEKPGEGSSGGAGYNDIPQTIVRSHAYEMRFLNANPDPVIVPDKAINSHVNYFIGNDPSKWAGDCKIYQAIVYRDVYPNIDVRYYTSDGILKYDFIVHPGGDVNRIAMYFDGVDGLRLNKGNLVVKTSVDEVTEQAPYTYQLAGNTRKEIPCRFDVKGNIVTFKLDASYEKNATLVIDPSLIFSSFIGSKESSWGYTATYDGRGNFYAGSIVLGPAGFPTSNGAFQTTFGGGSPATGEQKGFDMGIFKFDPTGANREYATYIGGSGNEQPHSMVVDDAGNLVISGRTSSANYPTAGIVRNYGPGGGVWDMVLTKLNSNGSALIASVKIGGGADDGVNIRGKYASPQGSETINRNYGDDARSEVILDRSGNIYVASSTQSVNFPTTPVSGQTTLAGTNAKGRAQDAVVLKFTPNLSAVLYSIIIGGTDDDAAFVLAINPINDHLFVGGSTASNNFPGPKTGVKFPVFQGGLTDGFVSEFTPNGSLVRTGYFGTPGIDMLYGIQFDRAGFPYITGTTTGAWPVMNATFSQANSKQFISKLKPDLSDFVYSTVFGNGSDKPNISPIAFLVDRCENVYVSGWGGTMNTKMGFPADDTKGLSTTPDAFQKRTDGNDFYFFVLGKNATTQLYGSFFGQFGGQTGEHVDGGTSRFDASGVIYQALCAICGDAPTGADAFPITPGVWSPNTPSGANCNLAAVKMAFNLAGVGTGIQASIDGVVKDTSGCVPLKVDFTDTLAQGRKYVWDFNDGGPEETTTIPSISHTFNTTGYYRVRLISIDSSTCNVADTAYTNIRVRDDKANLDFLSEKLPPCESLTYRFSNLSSATKPFTATSFRWDFGDGTTQVAGAAPVTHTYTAGGTYNVKLILLDTNYCNGPDSVVKQIRISPLVEAHFTTPASGCVPYTAAFTNTSMGGTDFLWEFGDGTTSTAIDPTHLYPSTGTYRVRLIASDTATCNKRDTSDYFTIIVSPNPTASFDYSPKPTQSNAPVHFQNSSSGGSSYKWLFGDSDTLFTIRRDTAVQHLYNASGTYDVCLVTYNNFGCIDTSCQPVTVTIDNTADVPKAFSPNGDGKNDRIYVRGYGIGKMTWSIYNRWGVLVYVSVNQSDGWDGTFKGVLQPQDVYHYTLQVEFAGKEKIIKKGDITLLR
jgi:gliding motility-associated-like protein